MENRVRCDVETWDVLAMWFSHFMVFTLPVFHTGILTPITLSSLYMCLSSSLSSALKAPLPLIQKCFQVAGCPRHLNLSWSSLHCSLWSVAACTKVNEAFGGEHILDFHTARSATSIWQIHNVIAPGRPVNEPTVVKIEFVCTTCCEWHNTLRVYQQWEWHLQLLE